MFENLGMTVFLNVNKLIYLKNIYMLFNQTKNHHKILYNEYNFKNNFETKFLIFKLLNIFNKIIIKK